MKKRNVLALLLAFVMAFTLTPFTARAATADTLDLGMSCAEAMERGFQIIDGDIYGLDGTLLIELDENGLTPDGLTLSDDFAVIGGGLSDAVGIAPMWAPVGPFLIAYGTFSVSHVEGRAITNIGGFFMMNADHPSIRVTYTSDTVDGVNFGVVNISTNQMVRYAIDVSPQQTVIFYDVFSHFALFQLRASGHTGYGDITIHATTVPYSDI